ncbi:MAG: sigma 54-interacting transcriptional regulator [Eubacteriales bacterium]|nr:sigma 54-interacting transcriptional regulator [Eubacteriales bacterium]
MCNDRLDTIKKFREELTRKIEAAALAPSEKSGILWLISKMEQESREFEENYLDFRELSNHLYDAIHITDGQGKVLFVNEAYIRTTGILPEQILGKNINDIEAAGVLLKGTVTPRVIQQKERISGITHFFPLDKETLSTGSPVFDKDGEIKFVVANVRDFSGLEQMKNKLDLLTDEVNKDKQELEYLRKYHMDSGDMLSHSKKMNAVLEMARIVAETDVTVLITGESGSGKEKIAEEIYRHSNRKDKPFIKVNCAAIPAELLESELFGYEGGAFTDASKKGKPGMFELANNGVILLDEIGDMPVNLQTKLLRVLQDKKIMRIGGNHYIELDIRVIAATNKELEEEIRRGNFRDDLYYRLNVVPISVIPLRERKEDIPYMVMEFLSKYCKKYDKHFSVDKEAIDLFVSYNWPGNIRELKNLIERLVVISTDGSIGRDNILQCLNTDFLQYNYRKAEEPVSLKEYIKVYEKTLIATALKKWGSKRKTAKALGIDHSTLIRKCREHSLD